MELQQIKLFKHFFRLNHFVYLDNNATTMVSNRVRRVMNRVLKECFGNPSSLYEIGRKSGRIIEEARQSLAHAINADAQELYFTSCATESNNAVLKSLADYYYPEKNKIISLPIEHPSVLNTLEFLKTRGIVVEYCPVDGHGRVKAAELAKLIDDKTFLICCMLANNETGTIQDMRAIAKIAGTRRIPIMSDCVQALGKIPVDVHALGIDYASFSAHKVYGPKGIGALYLKRGSPFMPFLHGGHQENGMRAGTESLHNIAGFGAACRDIGKLLALAEHIGMLKQDFIARLGEIKKDCIINSPKEDCLDNTVSVTFPNVKNAELLTVLDSYGIAVSAGSACSAQDDKPSKTLKAIGLSDKATKETIRFSLGHATSMRDIRHAVRVLKNYFLGKTLFVNMIDSAQVDDAYLSDTCRKFIIDVRPQFLRKMVACLPNSHEMSFARLEKHLAEIPKDKDILVVCHTGDLSYVVAYYLKTKGFDRVASLRDGVVGWRNQRAMASRGDMAL